MRLAQTEILVPADAIEAGRSASLGQVVQAAGELSQAAYQRHAGRRYSDRHGHRRRHRGRADRDGDADHASGRDSVSGLGNIEHIRSAINEGLSTPRAFSSHEDSSGTTDNLLEVLHFRRLCVAEEKSGGRLIRRRSLDTGEHDLSTRAGGQTLKAVASGNGGASKRPELSRTQHGILLRTSIGARTCTAWPTPCS